MSKKRKRKFLLALYVRSCRVNDDLFAEAFALGSYGSQSVMSRQIAKCGRSYSIFSGFATSAGSDIPNNSNSQSKSYFDSVLNTIFENKQLQKKFKHASQFGVLKNYNSATLRLFREELIKHMKANTACFDHYRNKPIYYYYNSDTKLNLITTKLYFNLRGVKL